MNYAVVKGAQYCFRMFSQPTQLLWSGQGLKAAVAIMRILQNSSVKEVISFVAL